MNVRKKDLDIAVSWKKLFHFSMVRKESSRSLSEAITDKDDTTIHPRTIPSSRAYANELGMLHPAPYLDVMTINTSHLIAPLRGESFKI